MAMASNGNKFKTVVFEDGTHAVVRTDPDKPRVLEVVATFYNAQLARDYADIQNSQPSEPQPTVAPAAPPKKAKKEKAVVPVIEPELSQRQRALLEVLHAKKDENNLVEAKAAVLAEAANIPLGSLRSILQSLEKKQLVRSTRKGSAKAPAVYQVL